ncbi:glycoside hydrolase family 15 protein [Actinomadura fulvescens]|uniref:Glycoside hydrolase family 15 protein n=1 Tax=Actinomadura fulvescens TaxID=46160 RepID=A0ABP6CD32_9ACTN
MTPPPAGMDGAYGFSPFPPIAEYAFLSDCETTALIAADGQVEWMCLPRMDSPSVFGAMLDRDAGTFRLGPAEIRRPAQRRYIPGTMVLETSWWTGRGWVVVLDALLAGPWHHRGLRSSAHTRAPTDTEAEHVLLRTVRCVSGSVQIRLDCTPVFDYGRAPAVWEYVGDDYHEAVARAPGAGLELRLTTDLMLGFEGDSLALGRTLLKEGEGRFAALSWSGHPPPRTYEAAQQRMLWTVHHWQRWLDGGRFPDHRWSDFLQRSVITLKGLTYAPTGAIAAAATTSLPETPGGERNWDYRYTWIRDATMTLWAMYALGYDWEANEFLYFIADTVTAGHRLQIMYGIDGRADLPEETLGHLHGYDGARPVRIGNGAHAQAQHDVWGAVVSSIYLHVGLRHRLDERQWTIVRTEVDCALRHWRAPDCGLWEVRGAPQHFVSSKVYCWLAAERGARLASLREEHDLAATWRAAAAEIQADILEHGVDERGVFVQRYGASTLDASALLIPILGFLPADDPRVKATVLAIADELTEDDLVLRYRTDETDDALDGEEGTFTICSFWLVSALIIIGEVERGRRLCEKLLSLASSLQLYGEEIDQSTGRHLGNFPQAFTHLALINAVMQVIRAERGLPPLTLDGEQQF